MMEPKLITKNGKTYNGEDGCRLTDCCHAYSTYMELDLCCKACYEPAEPGEGDGGETL